MNEVLLYTVYLGMREAKFAFVLQRLLRAPVMRCRIWNCRHDGGREGGRVRLGIYWYSTVTGNGTVSSYSISHLRCQVEGLW